MTFLEAAIEILRNVDGAMHFSEVARLAVEKNLLSHVGRDPEAAMRSCLNSAVRKGRNGEEPIIMREKPGHYGIRPGANLPDPPPAPEPEKPTDSKEKDAKDEASSSRRKTTRKKKTTRRKAAAAPEPEAASDDEPAKSLEFAAPTDAGLDGVTDVALVMANAVSRLVEERPELRDQLDTMQQEQERAAEAEADREPGSGPKGAHRVRDGSEERGGRRRRRRRRRGKRVEWAGGAGSRPAQTSTESLLDQVAKVLADAGSRSLHVRQISETLANQNVLGGEISEIERAVTAALLLDVRLRGRASRFAARGDARYQLQGTRLPEAVAKSEVALRESARTLERETATQLLAWLQSLGARALESLVRIYLEREGYALASALPPSRGMGKLVVDDPESDEEGRTLCVVIPRKTSVDPKNWEGEADRNGCGAHLFFCMGDGGDDLDGRSIGAAELAEWMTRNRIGVETLTLEVPVLDPTFVESVAGLDT
ncbi:MAG: winged helix-turn-helix domain-containing protein [Nannocystaceae bacterium]|nr:winged helix-turn-helix domain-containing protein [bacterium]